MAIPSFDLFIEPLLQLLAKHPDGILTSEAQQTLAEQLGVTADERRELLPSGVYPVYKSRIGWAHDRLKREALSTSVRRGFWKLTDAGIAYARNHPVLSPEELHRLAYPGRESRASSAEESQSVSPSRQDQERILAASPDDRIRDALTEIEESLRRDLLERILARDPEFFERLVLMLLKGMGYGTEERDIEHTGGTGDGGIDGVISLDQLGLDRVYIQAKRYRADLPIQKEAIHSFIGALHLKGANKGVFITTSRFTDGARASGTQVRGITLRLIDGEELTHLMIQHQVGSRHQPLPIPKLDLDFWEDE